MTKLTILQSTNHNGSSTTDVAPLNIIRTETILSRLPIHNLAKRGEVDISIITKNDHGEIDLKWEVSYNKKHGDARQLAYKLDTLVINRKIDELARPLPKIIRLGSLREIGKELGVTAGKPILNLRTAFLQNAFTGINAKLKYKSKDGTERSLEAIFTRYSVIFTGERLPDGNKADAVYLMLNEPYWEVLNNAPTRPLNYDYLKALTPAAQRFYEIISYKIFAALKYRHPTAKISYSEYCTFSAQQRCQDYEHVKKQMYKIHRPHLQSTYLKKVICEPVVNSDGTQDWMFYYTPGPKAVAEFRAFNKNHRFSDAAVDDVREADMATPTPAPPETGDIHAHELVTEFYRKFHNLENLHPQPKEIEQAAQLIAKHGIEKAHYVVNFSHKNAPATKFKPETFGGILHYTARATDEFEKKNMRRQHTSAIAQCTLCDRYGQVEMRDANKVVIMVTCLHDGERMKAGAKSRGYEFEIRNRDVSNEV